MFSPFKIGSVNISTGSLNTVENIFLLFLLLRSMLKLSSSLFPNFIENKSIKNDRKNFGFIYIFFGTIFYVSDFIYWTRFNFGIIDENLNLKLISIASLLFTYGVFELFRLVIETATDYFKES